MNADNLATVEEQPKASISAIWILPIIAAVIGGWLIYKAIIEAPINVTVYFESGDGIEVGKTQVRYEGMVVGKVVSVKVRPELVGIAAVIEMDQRTEPALLSNTEFWVVRPEVSLSGITGLSTVLSGNYITLRIGDGTPTRTFNALPKTPPKSMSEPGLHLTLKSRDLGSVVEGSPILYKKMTIGDVESYTLDEDGMGVSMSAFIEPEYAHLVRKSSRFYNASGVNVQGGLTGFNIRTESLAAIIKGGIVLTSLDKTSTEQRAINGDRFPLYDDYMAAEAGVIVNVLFPISDTIKKDITKVVYRGIVIGQVEAVDVTDDLQQMNVEIHMTPRISEYLNKHARFWQDNRELNLKNFSAVKQLLAGVSINLEVDGNGPDDTRNFTALRSKPILKRNAPGLHIQARVDSLKSIVRGSEILYRNVPVGAVIDYRFNEGGQSLLIDLHIEPQYQHLVNSSTRFWDASGVEISGGLEGLKIRTASLNSILAGGLAFYTPKPEAAAIADDQIFRVYDDYASAHVVGIPITLNFDHGEGLKRDTLIKYEGIEVGRVRSVQLNKALDGVVVKAVLDERAVQVATASTEFWTVKPEIGLAKTANLGTLLTGEYITFRLGAKSEPQYTFNASLSPPLAKKENTGLNIIIKSPTLGSAKEGMAVSYRGVRVGAVTGFRLADTADHVRIYVNIEKKFAPLIRSNTMFWNASGLDIGFKLFGGARIKTESLESVLAGGISFATPNNADMGAAAQERDEFLLYADRDDKWLQWAPEIELQE
ncbi:PqiB family protein [Oceanicoccus sagamiensis]|uniref:Mce/MlaD domain-containing protein n=1 Tax=Oceanicoccus sagamiensis TaxID=716816 RepID=A0A1X9NHW7_9GAMM|nr:MlaD family protein [Oceanicoccus sagamiensis]ARN75992.1 hypothetical protein BST96_18970 [Oceanicoccus sagamiensis]